VTIRQPLQTSARERHRQHDRELKQLLADVEDLSNRVEAERRDLKDDYPVPYIVADVRARLAAVNEHLNGAAWLLRGAKNVLPLALIGIALFAAQNADARTARPSRAWVCPQAYHGDELPATRSNIFRGICVRRPS